MWRLSIVFTGLIAMSSVATGGPYGTSWYQPGFGFEFNNWNRVPRPSPGCGSKARVELKALAEDGSPKAGPSGIVMFEQQQRGVKINGTIVGLAPGLHGFHVHEKGDVSMGCNSAGPHFNPHMVNHGGPSDYMRHVGDLGNIEADEYGVARIDRMDHCLSVTGVHGAVGRTLIVHERPDDLGRAGTDESLKTGSAGARLACGVIGLL